MRREQNSTSNLNRSGSASKEIQTEQKIDHFYIKSQGSTPGQTIKKILKENPRLFNKAIVYAQSAAIARQIYNQADGLLRNKAIILTGQYTKQKMQQKWVDFVTDGKVLVTNLQPSQIFIYDEKNPGVLNNREINLIIHENITNKQKYLARIKKSRDIGSSPLTVISLTTSEQQVLTFAQSLNIKIQKFVSKNQGGSRSNSKQGPKKNSQENPGARNNSRENPLARNNSRENLGGRNNSRDKPVLQNNFHYSFGTDQQNTNSPNIPKSSKIQHPTFNYYSYQQQTKTPNRNSSSRIQGDNQKKSNSRQKTEPQRPPNYPPVHRDSLKDSRQKQKRVLNKQSTLDSQSNDWHLLEWVRQNVIGLNTQFTSCLNLNLNAVYVDHTATNRPFKAVETMVQHAKLYAANPHTEFSYFGEYSTDLMKYSRDSLLRSFNSTDGQYVVLPTGAGSTGAIEKAVSFIKTWQSDASYGWSNPIIFVTPYEHHSNILPWVEFYPTGTINEFVHNDKLTINIKQAQKQILASKTNCVIVSVSAASNVTSKLTHLKDLNHMIKKMRQQKKKKIVFCVDCAAFCCHQRLDLKVYDQIDFAFLSPHKNLGGAESCGVLVARNKIIESDKPTFPGGGTVKFVKGYSKQDIMYEEDNFARQIAGTPPFFGFYRAALSFELLTDKIGYDFIHERQARNTKYFFQRVQRENQKLQDCQIFIYGDQDLNERANVVTFNIIEFENGEQMVVQQNFVSRILNDVFGIQVRSGCFCAGPHGIKLLEMTQTKIERIEQEVYVGVMTNKPGYVRLDLAFYLQQYEVEYIVSAIAIVARYWKNYNNTIYDLMKSGEIQVVKGLKKDFIYSLSMLDRAQQVVQRNDFNLQQKLRNRNLVLTEQLNKGLEISQNPLLVLQKRR